MDEIGSMRRRLDIAGVENGRLQQDNDILRLETVTLKAEKAQMSGDKALQSNIIMTRLAEMNLEMQERAAEIARLRSMVLALGGDPGP